MLGQPVMSSWAGPGGEFRVHSQPRSQTQVESELDDIVQCLAFFFELQSGRTRRDIG